MFVNLTRFCDIYFQDSIAVSIPIIKSTLSTLKQTNPTDNKQEIDARVELVRVLALYSKTGFPTLAAPVVPATVDPLNAASVAADADLAAAKTSDDDYQDKVDAAVAAHEAVVAYYVGILS
jgi:hypothetical protein